MQKTISHISKYNFFTLFAVVVMSFMATLDSSIVNVALPVMAKKLNVSLSSIEWIIASYTIIICATILFFGRLGDILGKSKVFSSGTILFTIGSLMCGLCHSFSALVLCRIIQGVGASAYMANNHGIITETFSKTERGKALGILVAAVALGTMAGPSLGGFIVSVLNWNYIFLVNVPIGIIVFLLGLKYLPKCEKSNESIDIKGAILQFAGTAFLFGAFIKAQQVGMKNPFIIAAIFIAIVLITLFIKLEVRAQQPLLELTIFRNRLFSLSLFCALISYVCIAASTIILPFYFQDAVKLSPGKTGLFLMLSPFILAVLSPINGIISDKIGPHILALIGLLLMAGGFFMMSFLTEHSLLIYTAIFVSVMAVGQSMFQPANNLLIMSNCPKNKLGISGSINSLVRNLGQLVGITLSTTLLYSFMSKNLGYHVSDYVIGKGDSFIYGMKNVYIILMITCLVGAAFTAFRFYKTKLKKVLM